MLARYATRENPSMDRKDHDSCTRCNKTRRWK
jgi:hypothetical protein